MPRLPRVYVEGAIYYITCRGNENEDLFKDKHDYIMYLELIKKYKEEYGFKLFAYVLQPQHIHLLIEPNEKFEISEIMRSLNTAYPKYFNNRYQRRGHLYRERFKACIAEKDSYLLQLISHIHSNPVRLGLSTDPSVYPYSSFSQYQESGGSEEANDLKPYLPGLSLSGFLTKAIQAEETSTLHRKVQRGGILGTKDFVKRVREEVKSYKQISEVKEKPVKTKKIGVLTWIFVLVGLSAVIAYLIPEEQVEPIKITDSAKILPNDNDLALRINKIADLNNTEWHVKLISSDGNKTFSETISFIDGKFISAYLSGKGFLQSNYSVSQQDKRIIWETMQSMDTSAASWRGEINGNSMQGILSLGEGGQTQVFSFMSISFRRK